MITRTRGQRSVRWRRAVRRRTPWINAEYIPPMTVAAPGMWGKTPIERSTREEAAAG